MPAPKPSASPATSKLDTSPGNATAALYSAAIGPISVDYYLPIFTRFEAAGRLGLAWNWAACLYTVNWMIFRGLGLAALAYSVTVAGAALLLFGLGRLIFQFTSTTEFALLAALVVLMFGIPGLLGNALLHTAYRKKMANALRESATLQEACAALDRQASSRHRFLWLVSVNALLMTSAVALYLQSASSPEETTASATTLSPQAVPAATPITQLAETAEIQALATSAISPSSTQAGPVTGIEAPASQPSAEPATTASAPQVQASNVLASPPPVELGQASRAPAPSQERPAKLRYYINVGLFAKEANAQNALNQLEQAGLSTLSSTVSTPRGERTRVRAGPFNSELEANAAAKEIKALNLDAVVMRQSL